MDLQDLFKRLKHLLTDPVQGWKMINEAGYSRQEIMGYFLIPLLFLTNLANMYIIGKQSVDVAFTPSQLFFIAFSSAALSIFVSAYLIAAMAPRFLGDSSFDKTLSLLAFSYTPVFIASILASLHEALQVFNLAALVYMVFLFYRGIGIMLNVPDFKRTGFTVVSLIILFSLRIFAAIIIAAIIGAFVLPVNE